MHERGREADRKETSGWDRKKERRERKLPVLLFHHQSKNMCSTVLLIRRLCHSLQKTPPKLQISRYRQDQTICIQTLSTGLCLLFLSCAFLSHFLTEIHCYSGATYFLSGSERRCAHRILLPDTRHLHPGLPLLHDTLTGTLIRQTCSLALLQHRWPRLRWALVRGRRRRVGCEVDAGGDGRWLGAPHLPAHLLGKKGEVLPQLGHTNLQLVPLAQQLLLLTHLSSQDTASPGQHDRNTDGLSAPWRDNSCLWCRQNKDVSFCSDQHQH